jgi:hypothetical protein
MTDHDAISFIKIGSMVIRFLQTGPANKQVVCTTIFLLRGQPLPVLNFPHVPAAATNCP